MNAAYQFFFDQACNPEPERGVLICSDYRSEARIYPTGRVEIVVDEERVFFYGELATAQRSDYWPDQTEVPAPPQVLMAPGEFAYPVYDSFHCAHCGADAAVVSDMADGRAGAVVCCSGASGEPVL